MYLWNSPISVFSSPSPAPRTMFTILLIYKYSKLLLFEKQLKNYGIV
jgi:hypothetical protein